MNYTLLTNDKCGLEYTKLEDLTYFLNTYYKLFVIIFGLLGNSMCIFIFWRSKLAHSSRTSFYLISLAISDIAFLLTLLVQYLDETKIYLTISKIGLACKTLTFFGFVINFLSVSLILALTVQRLCSICFPLKFFNAKIESKSKLIVGAFILLGCLLYFYPLYIYDVSNISQTNETIELYCLPQDGFENSAEIFTFVDSLVTLIFPFFAILTMNMIIIHTIKKSSYNFIIRTSSTKSNNEILLPSKNAAKQNDINVNNQIRTIRQNSEEEQSDKKESIIYYKSNNDDKVKIKIAPIKMGTRNSKHKTLACKFNRFKNRQAFSSNQSICDEQEEIINDTTDIKSLSLLNKLKHKKLSKRETINEEADESRKISPFEANCKRKSNSPTALLIQIPKKKFNKFNSLFKSNESQSYNNNRTRMSFRISGPRTNSVSAKISKMLIIVSTTFLILNLPIHSFNIYIFLTRKFLNKGDYTCIENYVRNIFNNLFFSSFSCNFLLYSISGVSFRNEFKRIVFKILRIKKNKI